MFSQFFINRPIFAGVISIVIVVLGLITIPQLPVEKTPDITPPTVVVAATYPGANAEVVAETVATPIEEAINGVDNLLNISSSCTETSDECTVMFGGRILTWRRCWYKPRCHGGSQAAKKSNDGRNDAEAIFQYYAGCQSDFADGRAVIST
jgi:hypothetical protein